jgi:pimeloyl-ACP methyl ester carboxylesterase
MKNNFMKNLLSRNSINNLFKTNKRNIASGATYQKDSKNVNLRGSFLKSRKPDMPTLIFFPEVMESVENYEKFFSDPQHSILDYRNVWILNPRNFGNSDHNDSFRLNEAAGDVKRFMDQKKLTIATVGGHGYGAKVACAFSTLHMESTSGVVCVEGGPIDQSYHPAWNEIKDYIKIAHKLTVESNNNYNEITKGLDNQVPSKRWRKILKNNLFESGSGAAWKFNMNKLALNVNRATSDLTKFNSEFGLFPGRALALWAAESHHIHLATNTIPFYKFFPRLEGKFPSTTMNFITTQDESEDSKKFLFIIFNYSNNYLILFIYF